MLIGIDANEANLTSRRVGINQFAFGLLHALHDLPSSHQFLIYLKTPPLPDLPVQNSNWRYRILPFPKLWTQTRLPWDLYIHSPRPKVFFSLTHYAPRFCPVPSVISIMDLGFLKYPDQFTAADLRQLTAWTQYSVRKAKKIITISEFSRQDIVTSYHRSPDDITVVYPGYDAKYDQPVPDPGVLIKYGIKSPYLLFLSSLKPSKNVEGLINGFNKFISTPPSSPPTAKPRASEKLGGDREGVEKKITLVIAGKKAWLYDEIFKLVQTLGLSDRVIFTGFVDEADTPALLAQAAAFVLPSFYEGFGIPVLEAMAAGVPVVVSRAASLPEVAGPAGIYVDPDSVAGIAAGIRTALGPGKPRFVSAGLKRVKLFRWAQSARQTLLCLEAASSEK
jgi:glycosyltransferase involved in cell wall biosynthesis